MARATTVTINPAGASKALLDKFVTHASTLDLKEILDPEYSPDSWPNLNDTESEWCFQEWEAYSAWFTASVAHRCTTCPITSVEIKTETYERFETTGAGTTYTACDGIPRFEYASGAAKQTSYRVVEVTQTINHYDDLGKKDERIPPRCQPNKNFCDAFSTNRFKRKENDTWNNIFVTPYHKMICVDDMWDCTLIYKEEVVLLHWNDNIQHRNICDTSQTTSSQFLRAMPRTGSSTLKTDAITFQGIDLYRKHRYDYDIPAGTYVTPSVLRGDFTFTYPTIYIAHRPIVSIDWVGKDQHTTVRPAGVFPIDPYDIYSLTRNQFFSKTGVDWARAVASGDAGEKRTENYHNHHSEYEPFNLADLKNPVPASLYYGARPDCQGKQTHCGTITDDTYRPTIALRNKAWVSLIGTQFWACDQAHFVDPAITLSVLDEQVTQRLVTMLPPIEPLTTLPHDSQATPLVIPKLMPGHASASSNNMVTQTGGVPHWTGFPRSEANLMPSGDLPTPVSSPIFVPTKHGKIHNLLVGSNSTLSGDSEAVNDQGLAILSITTKSRPRTAMLGPAAKSTGKDISPETRGNNQDGSIVVTTTSTTFPKMFKPKSVAPRAKPVALWLAVLNIAISI